ncbi:MAG: hypothetical protein E7Z91_07305 [Cyanobacteria bacterium SIG30]|nr:hypothetical protein [Cyanobacteria bacterium SIG30]
MILKKMLEDYEKKMQNTLKKEINSYDEIFDILEYYVFNYNKIEDKKQINKNVQTLSFSLLKNIDNVKEYMAENCTKDSIEHEYINRLELIIKFLPKEVDKSILIEVKDILEEDFERVSEPMPIEK